MIICGIYLKLRCCDKKKLLRPFNIEEFYFHLHSLTAESQQEHDTPHKDEDNSRIEVPSTKQTEGCVLVAQSDTRPQAHVTDDPAGEPEENIEEEEQVLYTQTHFGIVHLGGVYVCDCMCVLPGERRLSGYSLLSNCSRRKGTSCTFKIISNQRQIGR